MSKFLVMPEGCKWYEVERDLQELELVYRMECSFFSPHTRVAIRSAGGEFAVFSRKLDEHGNIREVFTHDI